MPFSALFRPKGVRRARFDDARLGFAVGDIHGRADLLARMLDRLEQEVADAGAAAPLLIFLGDYVDRGPDSASVISMLLDWRPAGFEVRFLKGNHEVAMMAFLEDPIAHRGWLAHGGLDTMASYGVSPLPTIAASDAVVGATARRLRQVLPDAHLDFLHGLERLVVVGDYAFVHAGIDCGRPIQSQSDDDLFWARHRFLSDKRKSSHLIVHGHTPVDAPYRDSRRICIDIGAYATGRLCAARFEGDKVSFFLVSVDDA